MRSREEVMEKVVRPEEEKAIVLAVPFDRRLPDIAKILHQHYKLLTQRNPGVKEWMQNFALIICVKTMIKTRPSLAAR